MQRHIEWASANGWRKWHPRGFDLFSALVFVRHDGLADDQLRDQTKNKSQVQVIVSGNRVEVAAG